MKKPPRGGSDDGLGLCRFWPSGTYCRTSSTSQPSTALCPTPITSRAVTGEGQVHTKSRPRYHMLVDRPDTPIVISQQPLRQGGLICSKRLNRLSQSTSQ